MSFCQGEETFSSHLTDFPIFSLSVERTGGEGASPALHHKVRVFVAPHSSNLCSTFKAASVGTDFKWALPRVRQMGNLVCLLQLLS